MNFLIQISGTHSEGHESKERLRKPVQDLLDELTRNGFIVHGSYVNHDEPPLGVGISPEAFTESTSEGDQAAVLTVTFASAAAAKLADEHNLTDTDFVGIEPSGATGFVTDDVRAVIKAKS